MPLLSTLLQQVEGDGFLMDVVEGLHDIVIQSDKARPVLVANTAGGWSKIKTGPLQELLRGATHVSSGRLALVKGRVELT